MSLFIGMLAFSGETELAGVRLGVLCGSLISAVVGFILLRAVTAGQLEKPVGGSGSLAVEALHPLVPHLLADQAVGAPARMVAATLTMRGGSRPAISITSLRRMAGMNSDMLRTGTMKAPVPPMTQS